MFLVRLVKHTIVGIPCTWAPCTWQINEGHGVSAKVRLVRLNGPCHLLPVLCRGDKSQNLHCTLIEGMCMPEVSTSVLWEAVPKLSQLLSLYVADNLRSYGGTRLVVKTTYTLLCRVVPNILCREGYVTARSMSRFKSWVNCLLKLCGMWDLTTMLVAHA